jgi:hypothetical protein
MDLDWSSGPAVTPRDAPKRYGGRPGKGSSAVAVAARVPGRSLPGLRPPRTYFGGTPMTFTPAPRETSIAQMTSWYFTALSPFTKMILSGRGS